MEGAIQIKAEGRRLKAKVNLGRCPNSLRRRHVPAKPITQTAPFWFDFVSFALFAVEIRPFRIKRLVNHCGLACYAIFGVFFPRYRSNQVKPYLQVKPVKTHQEKGQRYMSRKPAHPPYERSVESMLRHRAASGNLLFQL